MSHTLHTCGVAHTPAPHAPDGIGRSVPVLCDKFERRTTTNRVDSLVQGRAGQQAREVGGDAFDVRVIAFRAPRAQTLKALRELFGIDDATALQLVNSLPAIVRRGVSSEEAQAFVTALRRIGGEVTLDKTNGSPAQPPPPPPAATATPPLPPAATRPRAAQPKRAPQQPPRPPPAAREPPPPETAIPSDLPLPRPVQRQLTSDLEFDMSGTADELAPLPVGNQANDVGPAELSLHDASSLARKGGRQEFDLDAGADLGSLDLDPSAAAGRIEPDERERTASAGSNDATASPVRAPGVRPAREHLDVQRMAPMSRAAVVEHTSTTDASPRRSLALLQLLAAVAIGVGGAHLDSSIFYGNASPLSVVLHGLALQQLGYGVWRLLR